MCSDRFHCAATPAAAALAAILSLPVSAAAQEAAAPVKAAETVAPAPVEPVCDPSYVGVCIPPPPPDLDCGDIPHRRFRVIGSDPHGFDRDKDGIGCEAS
jgi:micrococcal nuclease